MEGLKNVSEYLDNLGLILGIGPKSVVGIDIGQHSVKVAEVEKKGKSEYRINKFAYRILPEGCKMEDEIARPPEVQAAIKECLEEAGISNKNVCIGLSGSNTTTKRLQIMDGKDNEIADQIMWEAEQYIPFGIDDSTISFSVIAKNDAGAADVMVAAVKNSVAQNYQQLIKDMNLKLRIVDLDCFAFSNVFEICIASDLEDKNGGVLLLDIGSQKTNLIIYKGDSVFYTREMAVGGLAITEEIQRQLSLSYEEAENIKTTGDDNGNLPEEVVQIIDTNLEIIFSEIKKTLNFFTSTTQEVSIKSCYISGGASLTPGLIEGLEKIIGVRPEYINPFNKFTCNEKKFSEKELDFIASSGCVALGLALRKLGK